MREAAKKAGRIAAPIFEARNWTYGPFDGKEPFVPSALDLAEMVDRMLSESVVEGTQARRCARFLIFFEYDEGGEISGRRVCLELALDGEDGA